MAEPKKQLDLSTLSPELRQIIAEKKISGQKRLKEWMRLLRELAAFDEVTDLLLAKAKKRFTLFLVLTIVSGFLTFFSFVIFPLPLLFLAALVVFFILMMMAHGKKKKLAVMDLSNDFRQVLVPFFQVMSEDINPRGRISLNLDLSGPSPEKIVKKDKIPPGRFKKVVETVYRDPWLNLEVPLIEGSRMLLAIENTFISQDRYWRNARGKNKHKQKWKKIPVVTAGLRPNPDLAGVDPALAGETASQMKISSKQKGDAARIRRKFKFKSLSQPPDKSVTVDDLVGMFFSLSSVLKPSVQKVAS